MKKSSRVDIKKYKEMIEEILNINLNNESWNQASLPIKYGGLGIRLLKDLSIPSYLSSVFKTEKLSPQSPEEQPHVAEYITNWQILYKFNETKQHKQSKIMG